MPRAPGTPPVRFAAVTARPEATPAGAPLRPEPERAGECPRCGDPLRVRALRLPGWRLLVDGDCGSCGRRYLQDLPTGHGLVYPASLDLATGELHDPVGGGWFARRLERSYLRPDGQPVALEVRGDAGGAPAVLLPCLDPVYGHALLKLLNATRHLRDGARALVVLIPAALEALVPDGVAETWIVGEPVGRLGGWLLELEPRLARELDRLGDCVLSPAFPHPHPSTYDLGLHVAGIDAERSGEPSIVLALRDDRTWGADRAAQARNVGELWERLRERLPARAGCAAIGVGEPGGLPAGFCDLRASAPDVARERAWLARLRGADLAIGVHGSHLLLPSGLACATIELLPASRFGNALQATLVRERDPVLALAAHRTIPGSDDLSDVAAERVAALAAAVLATSERVRLLHAGPAAGLGGGDPRVPSGAAQAEAFAAPAPPPSAGERAARLAHGLAAHAARARERVRAAREEAELRRRPLPAVVRDARGLAFELETHDELVAFAASRGHFEGAEIDVALRYLEPGMTAVDAGANVGAFAAALARAVAPGGAVHAFEPLPATRRRLARTLELNGLENVVVNAEALSDAPGTAELHLYGPGYESWASLAARRIESAAGELEPRERLTVPTRTLDDYAAAAGIERIDLLKVDVEGAEPRVLAGAAGLLAERRVAAALVEVAGPTLAAFGATAAELLELLDDHGLRPHVVEDGRLRPFRVAGRFDRLANVLALSPAARERLADLLG
jgi:FkbM family methyltransferase